MEKMNTNPQLKSRERFLEFVISESAYKGTTHSNQDGRKEGISLCVCIGSHL